jgi:hypothetical protein
MPFQTLTQARDVFRNDPTNKTAWAYLIKAVEYGANHRIDGVMFLRVVSEVVDYIEDSVRTKPRETRAPAMSDRRRGERRKPRMH